MACNWCRSTPSLFQLVDLHRVVVAFMISEGLTRVFTIDREKRSDPQLHPRPCRWAADLEGEQLSVWGLSLKVTRHKIALQRLR